MWTSIAGDRVNIENTPNAGDPFLKETQNIQLIVALSVF